MKTKQIEKDLKKGFEALIALTQLNPEFTNQIKQVEKWQKNKK